MRYRRERPQCRIAIERMGLTPFTVADGNGHQLWDGATVVSTGATVSEMFSRASAGLRVQMRLMVTEGHWPGVRVATTRAEKRAVDSAYWTVHTAIVEMAMEPRPAEVAPEVAP